MFAWARTYILYIFVLHGEKFTTFEQNYTKFANFTRLFFPHFATFNTQTGKRFSSSCLNKDLVDSCNRLLVNRKSYCIGTIMLKDIFLHEL